MHEDSSIPHKSQDQNGAFRPERKKVKVGDMLQLRIAKHCSHCFNKDKFGLPVTSECFWNGSYHSCKIVSVLTVFSSEKRCILSQSNTSHLA